MSQQDVTIPTPDGDARAFVFTPDAGAGPWPAVLFYMDGLAIRPTMFEMAKRLASNGYYVLLPDMFWRLGGYEPMVPAEVFSDPEKRQALFGRFIGSTNAEMGMRDTSAFLDWLAKQPQARADKIGVTGYCMGGTFALRAAGTFPDRVAAAGAFHAGHVVTDQPDSPHLLAPNIKAKVLVAGADQDPYFTEDQFVTLRQAMSDAGVDAEVTIYRGALHGYAPDDLPVYDKEHSERHWREMLALFGETLKAPVAA
ncbi:dienelactone hydrolase family protein [Phenylobacterium sp. LjRoot225]|uniref:dienelactone hydrolase family protein n=1 Tax=Phenylobacterium sp. LjRoot225 TaxID=3342285 RepID=UPI003ECEA299